MFALKNIVVENVLEIEELILDSSMISIEGQSGSGKSTLLRLLNNLDDPTSGTIEFKGEDVRKMNPQTLRKKVVMVPQNPVMFDGTIRENLLMGLRLSGEEDVEDNKLSDMLKVIWLKKDLDTKASDLSGGEKQRLALGRVLLMEKAEVYLLDEPSSDLDDRTTEHMMKEFIERARENQKQIIMITHDKEVSKEFADRVINMDQYSKSLWKEEDTI